MTLAPPAAILPAAWLGYAPHAKGGFAVRVCAWCSSKAEAERLAAPLPVTHSCCPACYQRQLAELLGEST